ncbi:MAG: type II secretion system protein GspN [Bdellovibrionota bacterium]
MTTTDSSTDIAEAYEMGPEDPSLPPTAEEPQQAPANPETPGENSGGSFWSKKPIRTALWILTATALLIMFTVVKLPEDRIKNYVNGTLSYFLAENGMSFSASESWVSIGLGISYVMKNVTLNLPPPEQPVQIEHVTFSPSLIPMIFKNYGGKLKIQSGESLANVSFSVKNTKLSASLDIDKLDLAKSGLLAALLGLKGTGSLDASAVIKGDYSNPSTMNGNANIHFKKFALDQQTIKGFSFPPIFISETLLELDIKSGKAVLKKGNIGKADNAADDLQATLSGDMTLASDLEESQLNIQSRFKISANILKSFILIDTFFAAGKQPDGSYTVEITGPLNSPMPKAVPK